MATTVASYLVVLSCQDFPVVVFLFLNTIGITEKLSTKPARRGRLSIRVLAAVVRFVIVAVPELTKTGAAAEPACYGSAETARPFTLHQPCSWELLR